MPRISVSGKIAQRNDDRGYTLDRAGLESLGIAELRTTTPWTDGVGRFRGVLARDLLDRLGAGGTRVHAVALNDYATDIPLTDFYSYPVLLAFEMDGKTLTPRDKGPLWIVYPLDDYAELQEGVTNRKMVWQLTELDVR